VGFGEIVLILLIFLALFGAVRLPSVGSGLGAAVRKFRPELKDANAPDPSRGKL